MTISLWHLRTLARHHGPVPDQAIEHRSTDHPAVITGAQLSPISAKPSTATAAQTSNPHSRPAAHRLPAGSFFGGFRTPALGSAARFNDRPASETLHGSCRSLPALDGVDYQLDPRAEFDLILIPDNPEPSAVGRLLGQASSPAPLIISQSRTLGARADLVLSDWSAASLAAAIHSLVPVITRVSELPRLPSGPDRDGLSALALAYTRDCSIAPTLRPDEVTVVAYPLLLGINNPRGMLEELAEAGMLRRRFFERLHVCHYCDSSRLHAREVCMKCHASQLTEHSLIHHYACGWQAVR